MQTSVERRKSISGQFSGKGGLNWGFFDAFIHSTPIQSLNDDKDTQLKEYGRPLTNAEIGCFKSHYALMADFVLNGYNEWLLVLEDDVWIDLDADIAEIIRYADRHRINYIRLFAKVYKPAKIVGFLSGYRQILRFKTDPYGTQAYLINKKGCAAFIGGLDCISVPIDDELGRFWRHGLDAYCVFPFPVVERSVVSLIANSRETASTARIRFTYARIKKKISEKIKKDIYNLRYSLSRMTSNI